ncbi:MAG: hypothetical protein IPK37_12220 [Austwickia sp.]|jgi:hypothetical protein|nr:MAG: hypothetical protein IPK37_12220 [Austwickia sp.]
MSTTRTGSTAEQDAKEIAEEEAERVRPSSAQVIGSAGAAVSAALVASRLGVAGTLIGAAVASIVSTIGAAYYTSFAKRTHAQVRRLGSWSPRGSSAAGLGSEAPSRNPRFPGRRGWWVGAAGAAFLLAVVAITALELGLGHPVSATEQSGTSVGRVVSPEPATHSPTAPGATPSSTSAPRATSTEGPTSTPTDGAGTSGPEPSPPRTTSPTDSAGSGAPADPSGPATAPPPNASAPVSAPAAPQRSN